jgi:NADH dehydrogenase
VRPDLTIAGHDEVYVIGDLAALEESGKLVPGVAPAAIQQGKHAAANIARSLRGEARKAFHYVDKGSLATIGRAAGVADFGRITFSGFPAWFAWLSVHVFFLIGFRNRFLVLIQWAWAYVTYRRGARLITGEPELRIDEPAPKG